MGEYLSLFTNDITQIENLAWNPFYDCIRSAVTVILSTALLVDEGTSALDRKNADRIEENLLSKTELTLILVSHHLSAEQKKKFTQVIAL